MTESIEMTEAATTETTATTIAKEGYVLVKKEFDPKSSGAGFSFFVLKFESVKSAAEKLSEATVLDLVNSAIAFSMRNKAKAAISDKATADKLRAEGQTLLITEQEADTYIPGEREPTTTNGCLKASAAAKKAGDMPLARAYMKKAMALMEAEAAALAA